MTSGDSQSCAGDLCSRVSVREAEGRGGKGWDGRVKEAPPHTRIHPTTKRDQSAAGSEET